MKKAVVFLTIVLVLLMTGAAKAAVESYCVPEPSSLLTIMAGLGVVFGIRKMIP